MTPSGNGGRPVSIPKAGGISREKSNQGRSVAVGLANQASDGSNGRHAQIRISSGHQPHHAPQPRNVAGAS